ncbi:hypothetical protein LWI29_011692 [Acer saccharum]|uniref:BFN domain-containing protein n=1 Tax=Acer saccharum TaxID=4024 RepID=A0AA39TDG8_ACESA|nr:hypothetical protein LWI29_011692 [Acer saccharum]
MLRVHLCVRTLSASLVTLTDHNHQTNTTSLSSNPIASSSSSSSHSSIRLCFATKRRRSGHLSCKSFRRSLFTVRSSNADDHDHDDFVEASLLIPETISHYRMRRQGFQESSKRHSSSFSQLASVSAPAREPRGDVTSIGHHFLRRFQNPTIFLKISCFGDYLLPIIVGEFAIERLIDALRGDATESCPDQFQFVRDVMERLGYEVKMVRITERVANTYLAKLYLSEPGENNVISVDLRPSDAINVANRCKAPIYVSKQIFVADAIRVGRLRALKPTYDVYLDSAAEGPDLLTEELDLLRNMDIAVKEERFKDAAKLRDELIKLRNYKDNV